MMVNKTVILTDTNNPLVDTIIIQPVDFNTQFDNKDVTNQNLIDVANNAVKGKDTSILGASTSTPKMKIKKKKGKNMP